MTYDARNITHGTQEVSYGPAVGGTSTSFSTGVFKFAPSIDQDTKDVYADAQKHMTLLNTMSLTIEQDNYQKTEEEEVQSGKTSINGGFIIGNGEHAKFSVQRILDVQNEDGTTTKKLEAYYNVMSGAWDESDDEDDDEINPKEYSRTLTVDGTDFDDGNGVVKKFEVTRTTANATKFDLYKTKILTPADFATS